MSFTVPLPPAHSFIIGPAVINTHKHTHSNVPIEVMVFIFYSDDITIDVKTGLVTRHKNLIFFYNIVISFATT